MKQSPSFFPVFILCFVSAFFIFGIGLVFHIQGVSWVQSLFAPLQTVIVQSGKNKKLSPSDSLQQQITNLQIQLIREQEVLQENQALRDQFAIPNPVSKTLLPAAIVSEPQFIPGVSFPGDIIIDKGSRDNVHVGMTVVYKDTLIGTIAKTTAHFSQVQLITSNSVSFTGYTRERSTLGIVRGGGLGQIVFGNILLSDALQTGDTVVTNGNTRIDGSGIAPGLVVGKVTSIEKNSSNLFQQANVQSLVDVTKLKMVFILLQ